MSKQSGEHAVSGAGRLAGMSWSTLARRLGSALVALVFPAVGAIRAATAPSPHKAAEGTPDQLAAIARSVAQREPGWERAAQRKFPGDRWSQDDDFHNQEQRAARRAASRYHIQLGSVLHAIDQQLRQAPDSRKVHAVPCKPRPFYD